MPGIERIKVKGEPTVYHVMSRTTLDGFVLEDVGKDFLLNLIRRLIRLQQTMNSTSRLSMSM